jgi:hypothetical protein
MRVLGVVLSFVPLEHENEVAKRPFLTKSTGKKEASINLLKIPASRMYLF